MGLFDFWTKRSKPREFKIVSKSSETLGATFSIESGLDEIIYPDIFKDLWRLYRSHPILYPAINKIAKTGASAEFFLYEERDGELVALKNHWLYDLFEKINEYTTVYDFWEQVIISLELTGNYIAEIEYKNGIPIALHYMYPQYVNIEVIDPVKRKLLYHYNVNGEDIVLPQDKVLHLKYFNAENPLWGLPPVVSLFLTLTSDFYARAYNKSFFKHGTTIGGVIELDEFVGDQEYLEYLQKVWESHHAGPDNAHKVIILEGGMKYKPIATTPKDAEFVNLLKYAREEILTVLGVPPPVLGIYEYASYANAKASHQIFWREKIVPLLTKLEQMITEFFIQRFAPNIYGRFDFSNVPALREDERLLAEIDAKLVSNGIMTINERRAIRGLPPLSWGDKFYAPMNKVPVKGDESVEVSEDED